MNVTQTKAKLVAASTLSVNSHTPAEHKSDNPAHRLGLKPAPLMRKVIEAIAAKHGIDLYAGCPLIKLELGSSGYLDITEVERTCISIMEYWDCTSDHCSYPVTIFWVSTDHVWYPIAANEDYRTDVYYVTLDSNGMPDKLLDALMQECLVECTNDQARRMRQLRWLKDGIVTCKTQDQRLDCGL